MILINHFLSVFSLDVSGSKPQAHLQLEFTEQDLCFLRLEEFQDTDRRTGICCPWFGHTQSPGLVYTRLLLLLYSVPG